MIIQSLLQIGLFLQITPGRLTSIIAGLLALTGVIIGAIAFTRSKRTGGIIALVLGLTGIAIGGIHLAQTTGGFGTGKGRLGAIVAIVIGIAGLILGRLALVRSSRRKFLNTP